MEISELTLKLIIILIPGAIASRIYQKITIHEKWSSFKFITNSILFGGISYLITELLLVSVYKDTRFSNFWYDLSSNEIPYEFVLIACLTAIFIGFVISAIDHYKILNWTAKKIKISNKYGDENLYSYFLNAKKVKEVYIRDFVNKITYHGMIDSYSEEDNVCEIVLWDVAVYNDDYDIPYYLDEIYLSRAKHNITIELPIIDNNKNNGKKTKPKSENKPSNKTK